MRPTGFKLRVRSAHLVGIGGSGMRALAEVMQDFGCRITGSDASLAERDRWQMHFRGLRVCAGHSPAHVPLETDVLIYSPAVPATNSERQAAERLGIRQLSLPRALGWLMRSRVGISVAGTHGKTTTTALVGHVLAHAGLSPSVVCGGEDRFRQASGWAGRGKAMVVESCEYRRHFLDLAPRHAILLNIEPDHFDCFSSLDDAVAAYSEFVSRLPSQGALVVNRDCPEAMRAAERTAAHVITFGRGRNSCVGMKPAPVADWSLDRLRRTASGWSFVVKRNGDTLGRFRLPRAPRHNVMNALAAIALADHLGVPQHHLQAGVATFAGVRRRFEEIDLPGGVTLIDDYAHHPSAIAGVLSAARERYPHRRLWCAFQPHQVSRTQALLRQFAECLAGADIVLIPPVFAAREQAGPAAVHLARQLARITRRQGANARFIESLDGIRRTIETETRPGDLFLILGTGDIDGMAHDISRRLRRSQAS